MARFGYVSVREEPSLSDRQFPRPFVVLGAGVAGLSVARELALRGARVTVIDRGEIGTRASGAATPASVGVLTAPKKGRSPLRRLQGLAHRMYPEFALRLRQETGMDIGFGEPGSLHLEQRPPDERKRVRIEATYREAGLDCRWLDETQLRDLVPGVSAAFRTALFIPAEGVVDPRSLVLALRRACEALGVKILEKAGETRLLVCGAPRLTLASGGCLTGEAFVISVGAWSAGVIQGALPQALPVRPIRGQAIEVKLPWDRGPNLRFLPSGFEKEYHVIARGDGRVWVGSTLEDVGYDESVTEAGRRELLAAVRDVFPEIREEAVVDQWAGLRPQALRLGGPFLGRLPGAQDVWVHCGHYRSGMLLSPLTARLLVHAILGDEAALREDGFDPEGFEALRVDR